MAWNIFLVWRVSHADPYCLYNRYSSPFDPDYRPPFFPWRIQNFVLAMGAVELEVQEALSREGGRTMAQLFAGSDKRGKRR